MSVPTQRDDVTKPSDFQQEIYAQGLQGVRPRFPIHYEDWPVEAEKALSGNSWGYVHGSAGMRKTDDNNRAAFDKWGLVPNRLVAVKQPDLSTKLLGQDLKFPIALAPVGVLKIFNEDGECGTAAAAADCGVPYTLSTAAASSIEEVAEASGDGLRFYQLYWPDRSHDDITVSLLKRAKENGYKAIMVTLDTAILGWRPADAAHAYNPFIKNDEIGVEIGFSDPVFRRTFKAETGKEVEEDLQHAAQIWASWIFPGHSHSVEDIEWLRTQTDLPIVLKGIQTVRDAKKAVELGVAGIVVSNHGGRQMDGCVASLDMLPEIADAVKGQIEIIFDSGVRTGSDVVKALALGADVVYIGRPWVYGLAFGGKAGVKHVLQCILADLDLTMQLGGWRSLEDLGRDCIRRVDV